MHVIQGPRWTYPLVAPFFFLKENVGTCYLPLMTKFEKTEFIFGIKDPTFNSEGWRNIKLTLHNIEGQFLHLLLATWTKESIHLIHHQGSQQIKWSNYLMSMCIFGCYWKSLIVHFFSFTKLEGFWFQIQI